jgi:hypothetical protein
MFKRLKKFNFEIKNKEESFFNKFQRLEKVHKMWVVLVAFLSTVLVWRGLHNLLDLYWFSQHSPLVSNLSAITVGLLIIVSTHYAIRKI